MSCLCFWGSVWHVLVNIASVFHLCHVLCCLCKLHALVSWTATSAPRPSRTILPTALTSTTPDMHHTHTLRPSSTAHINTHIHIQRLLRLTRRQPPPQSRQSPTPGSRRNPRHPSDPGGTGPRNSPRSQQPPRPKPMQGRRGSCGTGCAC